MGYDFLTEQPAVWISLGHIAVLKDTGFKRVKTCPTSDACPYLCTANPKPRIVTFGGLPTHS